MKIAQNEIPLEWAVPTYLESFISSCHHCCPMNKWMYISAFAILILFSFFAGCSTEPTTVAPVQANAEQPTPTISTFSIGSTATPGTTLVTIYSIKVQEIVQGQTPASMGSQYNDYTWAVVDVGVTNSDPSKTISVWIGNFKFSNATGYTYDAGGSSSFDKQFDGSNILPNDKRRGFLYFAVPKNDKGLKLTFANHNLSDNITVYKYT
jgi:hypothetical protein